MIKGILFFIFVWILFAIGIRVVYNLTSNLKLSLFKEVMYSGVTALITVGFIGLLVIIF